MPAPLLGIGLGAIAKAAAPAVAGGLIQGAVQRRRDRRAMDNQKELMGLQQQNQEKLNAQQMQNQQLLNQQGSDLQMDMWNKTNYEAQIAQMKAAGLNPALMYGMKGGGGTTTGSQSGGSASGGSAAGGNAPAPQQMDIGNLIQAALASAQIAKLNAETKNLQTTTESTGQDVVSKTFQNEINAKYRNQIEVAKLWDWQKSITDGEQAQAAWKFKNAIEYGGDPESQTSPAAKSIYLAVQKARQDIENAKATNDIQKVELAIKQFEQSMTDQGISNNAPWYAKLVTDLLDKVGILGLIGR
jgi:hypothetical protein